MFSWIWKTVNNIEKKNIISYLLLFLNKTGNLFSLSWMKLIFASIFPYLISEERRNILSLWPSQRRNSDPEQICAKDERNVGLISRQVSGPWVNSIQNCQTIDFVQYLTCRCSSIDVIISHRFLWVQLVSTFFSPPKTTGVIIFIAWELNLFHPQTAGKTWQKCCDTNYIWLYLYP